MMIETSNVNLLCRSGVQLPVLDSHAEVQKILDATEPNGNVQFRCYGNIQTPLQPPKIVESTLVLERNEIIGLVAMTGRTVFTPENSRLLQG